MDNNFYHQPARRVRRVGSRNIFKISGGLTFLLPNLVYFQVLILVNFNNILRAALAPKKLHRQTARREELQKTKSCA